MITGVKSTFIVCQVWQYFASDLVNKVINDKAEIVKSDIS